MRRTRKVTAHTVPVVHKALEILHKLALQSDHNDLTVKALAVETGTTPITCYRILRTLEAHDWIRPMPDGSHELSQGFFQIARIKHPLDNLIAASRGELSKLASEVKLTVKISVRQEECAVAICRHDSPRETAVSIREGATFPLAYGSSGAVLLSELSAKEIDTILKHMPPTCWKNQSRRDVLGRIQHLKAHGYCVDAGTYNPGYHALSVPIRDGAGHCIAALTAIGFPHEISPLQHRKLKTRLETAARVITKRLA